MVFPSQFVLSYLVSDHAFTNDNRIPAFDRKELFKHWVWMVLILLAFTFDTMLKTPQGIILILSYVVIHVGVDIYKKRNFILAEIVGLSVALLINIITWHRLLNSYITPEFSTYILGMTVTSVIPTTIFRAMGTIPLESNDSDGIFERLLVFVLINSSQYLWAFIILIMVLVYRLIFTKYSKYWMVSPTVGIILSIIWKILLYG